MPEIEIHATLSGISSGARFIYTRENEIFCVSPVPFVVGVNLGKACGLLYDEMWPYQNSWRCHERSSVYESMSCHLAFFEVEEIRIE